MIDIHSHILPKVDDGAKSLSESLQMLRKASEGGVKVIVATPHFIPGLYEVETFHRDELVSQLQELVDSNKIPIQVKAARECYLCQEILEYPEGIRALTYDNQSKYMLVESSLAEISKYAIQTIFEIQVRGIIPIIAHPERYHEAIRDPNIVADYINRGCLTQLNVGSLAGKYGAEVKRTGEILLEHDMIHMIASDIHSPNSYNLADGVASAIKILGEAAKSLVEEAPQAVLEGKAIATKIPRKYKPKRFFIPLRI